jgi:hypothetical protein
LHWHLHGNRLLLAVLLLSHVLLTSIVIATGILRLVLLESRTRLVWCVCLFLLKFLLSMCKRTLRTVGAVPLLEVFAKFSFVISSWLWCYKLLLMTIVFKLLLAHLISTISRVTTWSLNVIWHHIVLVIVSTSSGISHSTATAEITSTSASWLVTTTFGDWTMTLILLNITTRSKSLVWFV